MNTVHGLCTEALGTLSEVGCVVFHVHLRNSSIQSTLVIDLKGRVFSLIKKYADKQKQHVCLFFLFVFF